MMPGLPDFQTAVDDLKSGRLDAAELAFRQIVDLQPDHASGWNMLGTVLFQAGRFSEAVSCYHRAIRLNPNDPVVHNNLGAVLKELREIPQAMACYQHAIRLLPTYIRAHFNLGIVQLLAGHFDEGWNEYEWRIEDIGLPKPPLPKWEGSTLQGRRILLLTEQGLGDSIQFIRYIPDVKRLGGTVIVACQPSLIELFQCVEGIDELYPLTPEFGRSPPPFDTWLHLMSLPRVLGTRLESIPGVTPYLQARDELVQSWHREITGEITGEMTGDWLKVGIAWQGNRKSLSERGRSIGLSEFAPLARVSGVRLYSLQKGDGSDQVASLRGDFPVVDFTDRMDTTTGPFLDTAAIMMNLDLVITADTSIGHLAGALGVPVWVALKYVPDWRWMLDRDDTPWYPTMKLFRQTSLSDWPGLFLTMAEMLKQRAAKIA